MAYISKSKGAFIKQIFQAEAAKTGGIVRRKKASIEKSASLSELLEEIKRRGFHLIESGDQYIIICNSGLFKVHF
jgi:hypothetical protein